TARRLGATVSGALPGPSAPGERRSAAAPVAGAAPPADLDAALRELGRGGELEAGAMATRDAFGIALCFVGRRDPQVVVLDGDVANSTQTEDVAEDPELARRFVQCRIAEQNMMSCAAGLAAAGKLPFVTSFGKFLVRGYDQLELALIGGAALKLVGSH